MWRCSGIHVLSTVQVRPEGPRTVTCPEHLGQAMLRTGSSQLTSTSYRSHTIGSHAHTCKHTVGTHANTIINHRFTRTHMQTHGRHTCTHKHKPQVHKHTHANSQVRKHTCKHTVGSYAHTNIQHRFTCIHIQTHSRSTHTDTLRFVESHIARPLQTPPSPSPSLSPHGPALWLVPPFSPSLPSAPHQAKNRLTHCSSRRNRQGHLSPNLTHSLGLTSPRK